MLSKQSIRKEHTIYKDGVLLTKDEMVEISKGFSDIELKRFKKMLQQGGKITLHGECFDIKKEDHRLRNSKGGFDSPITLMKE